MASLIDGSKNENQPWLGLRRDLDNEFPNTGLTNPNLFEFIDGTILEPQTQGFFPWRQGRPNNSGSGNQSCVVYHVFCL